ncbi:MAG: hypothetical protein EAZ13_10185 [Sphingobacteriia bacterium]|nr:MAG: hypothetical protein EAZ35_11330 [Sphingobacteriia bacterium]TAH06221.1 MAG: hypothetical protein EAZ13_10185 [Sphingobacteriia bacterium]
MFYNLKNEILKSKVNTEITALLEKINTLQGGVYIFVNKKRNQIKLLTWEGDGLAIYYKRLEKGVYELPSIAANSGFATIDSVQLQLILQCIVLTSVRKKKRFSLLSLGVWKFQFML